MHVPFPSLATRILENVEILTSIIICVVDNVENIFPTDQNNVFPNLLLGQYSFTTYLRNAEMLFQY